MTKTPVQASAIAAALGKELVGENAMLEKPSAIAGNACNALMFARNFSDEICALLNSATHSLVIAHPAFAGRLGIAHILSDNPRLDYAISVQKFFAPSLPAGIAATARVAPGARFGKNIFVGEYSVIGKEAEIGDGSYIGHNVVLNGRVKIGRGCIVQSGSIIGERALAFEYNEKEIPVAVPHLGGVTIGDFVEIGSLSTVCAGTINDTIVSDYTKIDDHVHIAHNCMIGKAVLITAGAKICGSVKISDHAWIGSNCSITNGVRIGAHSLVGIGSTVMKDVEDGKTVAGNPARVFGDRKAL